MSLLETKNVATNKYELSVKIEADAFEAAVQAVYKRNVKKIDVQGFRKGKAPRAIVEKMYGEGVFFEEAINDLYPKYISEAIVASELEIVARPDVEILSVAKGEDVVLRVTVVTKPEVTVKDYKGIAVDKTVKAVTDEDIDATLKSMQERNGRTITVEDRAAVDGDTVNFDFEGFKDDVAFEGGKAEGFSLKLGSGQFIPGFEEQIVGKEIGEEFDVNVSFPEDYHVEDLAGAPVVFKCKLHGIEARELPELDDEFAKDTSEFDTLDELKADLRTKAEEANERTAQDAVENSLIDAVIENMEGEIPAEMNDARVDDMIRDFEQRLQSQGLQMEMYLQYTGMDMAAFRKTFEAQAEKQVKIRLALEKIAAVEEIKVSEEEIEAEYARLAEQYKMEVEQIKQFVPASEFEKDMAINKAIDLVRESAVITVK